jgi:hypothetical protein
LSKLDITLIPLKDKPELEKEVNTALGPLSDDLMGNKFAIYRSIIKSVLEKALPPPLPRLLVYCSRGNYLAQSATRSAKVPSWGLTDNFFAAVWKQNNEWIIWHEALHTLGADDCYEMSNPYQPKPDCNLGLSCVMQYEHTNPEKTLAPWPFLCEKNIQLLIKKFRH